MDVEKTMQFILDQQAHFSSDIARINLIQERTNEILARLADRQTTTEESFAEFQQKTEQIIVEVGRSLLDVANSQERTNEILANLAERQVDTEGAMLAYEEARLATEEAMRRLAERQATTEENLNVLLLTVERHIANHN